ncbi:winged helix-turn-helix transcriptional regulator [Candidatus Nitrosotenuis aquarius]|uniref:winged helix-turn-helix transcriptional regulator n=1 Tax=Candidatus Nitrosotenuis aquarius TaxID=1846278 RepID=UPI000C1DFCB4|nr:ArsR family transcriptional regulator [Candidatus Nitrosotenuis aquarius]
METRVEAILELVSKNPGISYSEIMRETGFKNGVLSHHLSKIEESGKITIQRSPRVARIYPCGIQDQEAQLIKDLRNPTMKKIIVSLLEKELSFKEITRKAEKSQGTVSVYLKEMTEQGIVTRKLHENELVFCLADSNYIREIIAKHQTSLFERTADNISDIFSSI